jgi:hypothetical protein
MTEFVEENFLGGMVHNDKLSLLIIVNPLR